MNAPKRSVAIHQNVTTCQAIVASCFDFAGRRNKIVYDDMNFPSVMYFWEAQRSRGARVHMVRTGDGVTVPTERLLDAIDEETLLVPISHVLFRSAYINDAFAITEKAHKVGALVVLDTFQSLGTVPVDVQALNVDFACGGVLKWLCGGPGVAYLYVRPDLGRTLTPTFTGWFAHADPFARSEEHTSELQSRFDLVCRLLLEKKKKMEDIVLYIQKKKIKKKTKKVKLKH